MTAPAAQPTAKSTAVDPRVHNNLRSEKPQPDRRHQGKRVDVLTSGRATIPSQRTFHAVVTKCLLHQCISEVLRATSKDKARDSAQFVEVKLATDT